MAKTAPTSAPTSAPTGWKDHWHNYHDPRPVPVRGKIHWEVTKPVQLQKGSDKSKKLSSGTSDPRVAEERKWDIAAKIYQWFDDRLAVLDTPEAKYERFISLASAQWVKHKHPKDQFLKSFPPIDRFGLPDMSEVINLFAYMKIEVTQDMLSLLDAYSRYELTYNPLESDDHEVRAIAEEINKSKDENASVKASLADISSKLSGQNNPNEIIAPKTSISNVGKRYIKENKWGRERTKSGARLAIIRFGNCIGADKDIADITAKDGYAFAKHLEDEYQAANKTIKSSVSYVKGMFTWAITVPEYESINSNPWPKLLLTKFGNASEEYLPFKPEQISALFALAKLDGKGRMNRREHLLLSILIATGCRLDEAALLCWENIIKHKEGWHYIDLTKAIVKNSGSRRLLPIPFKLQSLMPPRGHQVTVDGLKNSPDDRLYDYSLDGDGKASRVASQACGRQIAKINRDNKQVTHSLRGNLKDLLRDAGVSKELNHYIIGHSQGDVGSNYGQGHSIEKRYEALNLPEHPYLSPYDVA